MRTNANVSTVQLLVRSEVIVRSEQLLVIAAFDCKNSKVTCENCTVTSDKCSHL